VFLLTCRKETKTHGKESKESCQKGSEEESGQEGSQEEGSQEEEVRLLKFAAEPLEKRHGLSGIGITRFIATNEKLEEGRSDGRLTFLLRFYGMGLSPSCLA
jgi:hypothetical protein